MNPHRKAFKRYVGMTEEDAVEAIKREGLIPRIVMRDGKHYIVTMDYRLDRINLAITNGQVTSVHVG